MISHKIFSGLTKTVLLAVALGSATVSSVAGREKPRLMVLTDIGGDPDDAESMVRLLVYSNEFDLEALIAVRTGDRVNPQMIRERVEAYGEVLPNLRKHADGWPTPDRLLAVTKAGLLMHSVKEVAPGKGNDSTKLIIDAVDRPDPRPVWITLWGGAVTLAQALADVRATRTPEQTRQFIDKLRVYAISDQDDAGWWIRREFPGLFYIVTPSHPMPDWSLYHLATWTGISGDRKFKIGPFSHFDTVDNPWLKEHIQENHGPLGALYPPFIYIMEGDTPSWLGLVNNGLGWETSPAYGGWGGRYVHTSPVTYPSDWSGPVPAPPVWTNNDRESRDSVVAQDGKTYLSDQASIWRWREHFQNDFAARMDWCVADEYKKANHNPVAVLNGDRSREVVQISAKSGTTVSLSAAGTSDPDGNAVNVSWYLYPEAGNVPDASLSATTGQQTEVRLPRMEAAGKLHVILQVEDTGTPPLFSYRRAVVSVTR